MFRDITPLLQDAQVFRALIGALVARHAQQPPDVVAGIDARGFILGAVIAHELERGFVPIRKQGKLPHTTVAQSYTLEYGSGTVEMHVDSVRPGQRVLLVDDLVATGGTLLAGAALIRQLGGTVSEALAIVDLPALGGSARLRAAGLPLFTLLEYDEH
jgi:adenine phosphoribosyltransferase